MLLHERVATIIGYLAGRDPASIGPGTCLGELAEPNPYDLKAEMRPLDLDSLDRVELIVKLEEEFHIKIGDEEVDACDSHVGAVVALVADKLDSTPLILRSVDKQPCPSCGR